MSPLPERYRGPGLVDLQVNGYAGTNFNGPTSSWTPEAMHRARAALRRRGVAAALPTIVTDAPEAMLGRARRYGELVAADAELAATFPLLHVEGPFLCAADGPRGAHSAAFCTAPAAAPDLIERIRHAAGGRVGIVTLAPELPGAIALIERLAANGVCAAIGHTQAPPAVLDEATRAGAKMSTHLGNGSHPTLPRLDNYVQRQLADDRLAASFIADGHHVPFPTLKNFLRAKTPARSVLVTDAIAAADLGPGQYDVAGWTVVVTPEGRAYRPGQDNLAGSALTLDRAVVSVCLRCGVEFSEAWAMASTRPAALVGLPEPGPVAVAVSAEGFAAA